MLTIGGILIEQYKQGSWELKVQEKERAGEIFI